MTVGRCLRGLVLSGMLGLAMAAAESRTLGLDGEPRAIDDYAGKGKWVVVVLWASDCHICSEEAPMLADFHRRHATADAIVLGVSIDGWAGRDDALGFIRQHEVPFDNLIMEPPDAAALYARLTGKAWIGTPTFVVYAPDGRVVAWQVGAIEPGVLEDFMARFAAAGAD